MMQKSFYESAFLDMKRDIIDQINEINESSKKNPKVFSNLMLFYEFIGYCGFSYRLKGKLSFIPEWMVSYFNRITPSHLSIILKNNKNSIESILKAYRSLHEFDFEYESLGFYLYKNTRYHSLYSAIILICESEDFVHPSDNYFHQMTRNEVKELETKISDEFDKLIEKFGSE